MITLIHNVSWYTLSSTHTILRAHRRSYLLCSRGAPRNDNSRRSNACGYASNGARSPHERRGTCHDVHPAPIGPRSSQLEARALSLPEGTRGGLAAAAGRRGGREHRHRIAILWRGEDAQILGVLARVFVGHLL